MCEFCKEWKEKDTICGSDIPIYYCGHKDSTLTQAQILRTEILTECIKINC